MEIEQARQLAERYLAGFSTADDPLALFENESAEDRGWCFVFPWNTVRHIRTRDIADIAGPGFGPIVVVKSSGDVWMMGGFPAPDEQLAAYAAKHGISRDRER